MLLALVATTVLLALVGLAVTGRPAPPAEVAVHMGTEETVKPGTDRREVPDGRAPGGHAAGAGAVAAAPGPPRRRRSRSRALPRAGTMRGALRRALLSGRIDRGRYASWRRVERRARAAARRLHGARRAEMGAVLRTVEGLARRGLLTVERMPAAFLTLRRNTEVWTRRSFPVAGERLRFSGDAAVFQYFAGRGIVLHPLASFGPLNALARLCLERRREQDARRLARAGRDGLMHRVGAAMRRRSPGGARPRCPRRALRRGLDRLVGLAASRGGFTAWEYVVDYGGGTAPWISGMAQATAIQALARGAEALERPRWMRVAHRALGAFEQGSPIGVRVAVPGGAHYAMYSFAPGLQILNGFLQSVIGLHDMAELSGSARARRLYVAGERVARRAVTAYDTGAWSLYARAGRESTLHYHELVQTLLASLCTRAAHASYCAGEQRFARYVREPPRLRLAWADRIRAGRAAPIGFSLSKISSVRVRVRRAGTTVLQRELTVPRGRYTVPWTAGTRGRYRLHVVAIGPAGRRAVRRATIDVTPRPRQGRRHGERPEDRARERRPDRPRRQTGDWRPRRSPTPASTPVPSPTAP